MISPLAIKNLCKNFFFPYYSYMYSCLSFMHYKRSADGTINGVYEYFNDCEISVIISNPLNPAGNSIRIYFHEFGVEYIIDDIMRE